MPKPTNSPNQRLKLLYLQQIFMRKTDIAHQLTTVQLCEELKRYGISAGRKAIYDDIELLRTFGLDIIATRSKTVTYFLGSREFELPELKLLADAVSSARFLTLNKSNELLKKIEELASENDEKEIKRQLFVADRVKAMNEKIYLNVDTIHRAINEKKQITFRYFDYDLKLEKKYREGLRTASPYALTWDDERYYLVSFYEKYPENLTNFRVDRMENIEVTDEPAVPLNDGFNIADHINSTFSMFSGTTTRLNLRFDNSLINAVHDRFGNDLRITADGDSHFIARVNVKPEAPFFGWLFQFGAKAELISPDDVKKRYSDMLRNVIGTLDGQIKK